MYRIVFVLYIYVTVTVCVCNVADATRTIATRRAIRRRSCRWAAACALRRFSCARNRFTRSTSSPNSASWEGQPQRQRQQLEHRHLRLFFHWCNTMPQSMVSKLATQRRWWWSANHHSVTHPHATCGPIVDGLEIGCLIEWSIGPWRGLRVVDRGERGAV